MAALSACIYTCVQEIERVKQVEDRLQAESESDRLYGQRSFDQRFLEARSEDLGKLEAAVYERTSWEKYLECNPLPDVTQEVRASADMERSGGTPQAGTDEQQLTV